MKVQSRWKCETLSFSLADNDHCHCKPPPTLEGIQLLFWENTKAKRQLTVRSLCPGAVWSRLMQDAWHDELKEKISQNDHRGRLSGTAREQEGKLSVTISITVTHCACDSQVCCSATSCRASFARCCISCCEHIVNNNAAGICFAAGSTDAPQRCQI